MGVSSSSGEAVRRRAEEAEVRRALEVVTKREAEEVEARRAMREVEQCVGAKQKSELAQEAAKNLKKDLSMKECMFDFAQKFPGDALEDICACELMSWLKSGALNHGEIREEILSLHDPVLNEAANQWIIHNQPEGIELLGDDSIA